MEERAVAETTQTLRSAGVTRSKKKTSQLKEIWRRYRKNKAAVLGLVILVFILLAAIFQMNTILWIADKTINVGIIAILVIFQPEMRKALEQLGRKRFI